MFGKVSYKIIHSPQGGCFFLNMNIEIEKEYWMLKCISFNIQYSLSNSLFNIQSDLILMHRRNQKRPPTTGLAFDTEDSVNPYKDL